MKKVQKRSDLRVKMKIHNPNKKKEEETGGKIRIKQETFMRHDCPPVLTSCNCRFQITTKTDKN